MRSLYTDEGGISPVVATLLLLSIFIGIFAIYMTVTIPSEFATKEKEHMSEVRDSFLTLQSAVQEMSAGESRNITVPMSANLVSGLFRGPSIGGRLAAVENSILYFEIQNAYYSPQIYVYENGAVILFQPTENKSIMVSPPTMVSVSDSGDSVTIRSVRLVSSGEVTGTGTGTLEVSIIKSEKSGSGTPEDPFIITNVDQLQTMNDDKTAHYALGNDIDASATITWNDGAGFVPIGDDTNKFTGSLDGRGYKITDLYINRSGTEYQGLFGYIGSGGVVENVGLEDGNVTGDNLTGGLAGYNDGTVEKSYFTGSVTANYSGAFIGYNNGVVSNCYSTGSISGDYTAGFIGYNQGVVSNSYSTGFVSGDHTQGFVGNYVYPGTASNSFWDIETSGTENSMPGSGETGKTTENMKYVRTYTYVVWSDGLDTAWDFVDNPYDDTGNEDIWDIDGVTNDGYPFLSWQVEEEKVTIVIQSNYPDAWRDYLVGLVEQLRDDGIYAAIDLQNLQLTVHATGDVVRESKDVSVTLSWG